MATGVHILMNQALKFINLASLVANYCEMDVIPVNDNTFLMYTLYPPPLKYIYTQSLILRLHFHNSDADGSMA